jgi:hypothetical protein
VTGSSLRHISSIEHISIAEAMADLQTSIAFDYGSIELADSSLPALRSVTDMLRRHTALEMSIEAHCGLEAQPHFAQHFTRRRALAVKHAMEQMCEDSGVPGALQGRLFTRAWGNSRPLIWAHDGGGVDTGAKNRRVEMYLRHGEFEAPKRRGLSEYARRPGAPLPEAEVEADEVVKSATFDGDVDVEDEEDWGYGLRQQVVVQLPDGRQVQMPLQILQQLQQMEPDRAISTIMRIVSSTSARF